MHLSNSNAAEFNSSESYGKVRQIGIESDLYSIEYVPKTGRNKGNTYEQFYKGENFRLFAWLKDVAEEINGILYKKDLQGTLWDFVGETKILQKRVMFHFLMEKAC